MVLKPERATNVVGETEGIAALILQARRREHTGLESLFGVTWSEI
jgi:hypothetical protein